MRASKIKGGLISVNFGMPDVQRFLNVGIILYF